MTFFGLELNATRARGVSGDVGEFPLPVPLDPPAWDLPMVLNLDRPAIEVGHLPRRRLCEFPHLVCHEFLHHLSEREPRHRWKTDRHNLDGDQALAVVWQRLRGICGPSAGVVVTLPDYLHADQARTATALAGKTGLRLRGAVPAGLASVLAAYAEQTWFGSAIVLDADEHALTLSLVTTGAGQARLAETLPLPHLGLRMWNHRLVNGLADCCVVQSRRDPRASPAAEQALYEELDGVLDACRQGRHIQLGFQASQWYQNLVVSPDQPVAFCAPLLRQLMAEIETVWTSALDGPPGALLLTAAAGRLPGVVALLRQALEAWTTPLRNGYHANSDDFGEDLIDNGLWSGPSIMVLGDDACARAAHALAEPFQKGELSPGYGTQAPLPLPQSPEAGPARLHFQGQDFLLTEPMFLLGTQPGCHLVLHDVAGVSPRHCEILCERRAFRLVDRSQAGTLVNDRPVKGSVALRPGDWIRLGPEGPLLRFLGGTLNCAPLTA